MKTKVWLCIILGLALMASLGYDVYQVDQKIVHQFDGRHLEGEEQ